MNTSGTITRKSWRIAGIFLALALIPVICGINAAPARAAPINIATGNLYDQVTDYTTVGTNPLAMIRSYNSLSYTRNLQPSLIGPNWRTNYDRYLRVYTATQVSAERADGRVVNFTLAYRASGRLIPMSMSS